MNSHCALYPLPHGCVQVDANNGHLLLSQVDQVRLQIPQPRWLGVITYGAPKTMNDGEHDGMPPMGLEAKVSSYPSGDVRFTLHMVVSMFSLRCGTIWFVKILKPPKRKENRFTVCKLP